MTKTIKLRPWQSEAINKCLNWFLLENKKKFLIKKSNKPVIPNKKI